MVLLEGSSLRLLGLPFCLICEPEELRRSLDSALVNVAIRGWKRLELSLPSNRNMGLREIKSQPTRDHGPKVLKIWPLVALNSSRLLYTHAKFGMARLYLFPLTISVATQKVSGRTDVEES